MKICLLDDTKFIYNYNDLNSSKLRGAEIFLINIAKELSKLNFQISIINNCPKNERKNNINWININSLTNKPYFDVAISNNDCNLFKKIYSKKNILVSHSIQSLEKFVRKKQLFSFLKYKPQIALLGKHHLKNRSYLTRLFGYFFLPYGVDDIFLKTKLLNINVIEKKQAIYTSRSDRNLDILIDLWINKIRPKNNELKLLVTPNNLKYSTNLNIFSRKLSSRENMINDLIKSRMLILPGHKAELFCLAAEEARELCVPIVTLGLGSLSERVIHYKTGLIAKNKIEFVDFILELFENDELWNSLRSNLINMRNSKTWEFCAKKLMNNF